MNETGKSEIFVVDDDQGILDSFDAMLGDDYPLVMLNDSRQALALMCERKPRLLFLDIKMPGMNGIEFLEHAQHCGVSSTQIVIVTAVAQDHYEEMARNYGVYQYLRKPLDVDEIESITKTVLH